MNNPVLQLPMALGARAASVTLRYYQREAVDAVLAAWASGVTRTLIVAATGLGKTQIFAAIAAEVSGRVLVLSHRDELVEQAKLRLEQATGEWVAIEKADHYAGAGRLVSASVQTLCKQRRLDRMGRSRFDYIITDECHHSTSSSYKNIYEHFTGAKHLGVTATPRRLDNISLVSSGFEHVSYAMEIWDGIEAGFLVPVTGQRVVVSEIELDEVSAKAGKLVDGELDAAMLRAGEGVVHGVMRIAPEQQAIVFCPGLGSANYMLGAFNREQPDSTMLIHAGTDPDQRRILTSEFRRGRWRRLVNVGIATEGYDAPTVSLIVQARPTLSKSLYTQMIGRSTRVLPGLVERFEGRDLAADRRAAIAGSAKPEALVLDFVGNSTKHALARTEDVLGGKMDAEVVERAKKIVDEEGKMPIDFAFAKAQQQLAAERAAFIRARNARIEAERIDMFERQQAQERAQEAQPKFGFVPCSQAQRAALKKFAVTDAEIDKYSKRQASAVMEKMIADAHRRRQNGLCTRNQEKLLTSHGCEADTIRFEHAGAAIEYLKSLGWGHSQGFDAATLTAIAKGESICAS
jgi:superfamily II DNA or RNA helicase